MRVDTQVMNDADACDDITRSHRGAPCIAHARRLFLIINSQIKLINFVLLRNKYLFNYRTKQIKIDYN